MTGQEIQPDLGATAEASAAMPSWTLVTSHGLVLLYLAAFPDSTMRTVAKKLGLTERRVIDVIRDLESADLLTVAHDRRQNHYSLNAEARFRHPVLAEMSFSDFLQLWQISQSRSTRKSEEAPAAQ